MKAVYFRPYLMPLCVNVDLEQTQCWMVQLHIQWGDICSVTE